MACGCQKNRTQTGRIASRNTVSGRIRYEAFGGDLEEPEAFDALSAARDFAAEHRAKVRSIVEPAVSAG